MSEVSGAVTTALAALKEAGEAFRRYEAHHQVQAAGAGSRADGFDQAPGAMRGQSSHHAEATARAQKAIENGRLAQMCGKAAADLEDALAAAFQGMASRVDRPRHKSLDAFEGFAAGWAMHAVAAIYLGQEEPQGPAPACTLEDAVAVFRAQLANGVA